MTAVMKLPFLNITAQTANRFFDMLQNPEPENQKRARQKKMSKIESKLILNYIVIKYLVQQTFLGT